MDGRCGCECCELIDSLLQKNGVCEKIVIWHAGYGSPDHVQVSVASDSMDPVVGTGTSVLGALRILSEKVAEKGGL